MPSFTSLHTPENSQKFGSSKISPQKGPLNKSKQNSNFNLDLISNSSNSLLDFKFPKSQKRNKNKNRKYEKIAKRNALLHWFLI